LPDPLYHSKMVTRLINNIMLDGKKRRRAEDCLWGF
jgi:ribosomal protein S7